MRNRDERFNWLNMSPAQQLHVIKLCRQRYLRKLRKGQIDNIDGQEPESPQQDLF
jgi:predicted Fe-S protein YdhL (DUF1289 family)